MLREALFDDFHGCPGPKNFHHLHVSCSWCHVPLLYKITRMVGALGEHHWKHQETTGICEHNMTSGLSPESPCVTSFNTSGKIQEFYHISASTISRLQAIRGASPECPKIPRVKGKQVLRQMYTLNTPSVKILAEKNMKDGTCYVVYRVCSTHFRSVFKYRCGSSVFRLF